MKKFVLYAMLAASLTGCNSAGQAGQISSGDSTVPNVNDTPEDSQQSIPIQTSREHVTIEGTLHQYGGSGACAAIRTDAGDIVPVSELPRSISIGARIEVSGPFGTVEGCGERVVMVHRLRQL